MGWHSLGSGSGSGSGSGKVLFFSGLFVFAIAIVTVITSGACRMAAEEPALDTIHKLILITGDISNAKQPEKCFALLYKFGISGELRIHFSRLAGWLADVLAKTSESGKRDEDTR